MQKVEGLEPRKASPHTPSYRWYFCGLGRKDGFPEGVSPYDGPFHVGLIRIYSHHISPFLGSQPDGANQYGAVARDPSYLYHYLMSFPYRLVSLFTDDRWTHVYILRGIDIALGLVTLYIVYLLGRQIGLPKWGAQLVSLGLAITPVFYDLAAQVNYDNLMLPLVFGSLLLTMRVTKQFRNGYVPAQKLLILITVVLLACLVKYSYLPFALAIGMYLIVVSLRQLGVRHTAGGFSESFKFLTVARQVCLVVLVVVAAGLWFQRYGINIMRYHTPHPQCHVVLSVSACSSYGVWERNYQLHQTVAERPQTTQMLAAYSGHWIKLMYGEIYATIERGSAGGVYLPVPVITALAPILLAGGLAAALLSYRLFSRQEQAWFFMILVSGTYLLILWGQNISDYHNLHQYIGVQGRYLLPVLPLLYLVVAGGYGALFERLSSVERGRIRAMVSALFVIGWLGLRSIRRIGHVVLYGIGGGGENTNGSDRSASRAYEAALLHGTTS